MDLAKMNRVLIILLVGAWVLIIAYFMSTTPNEQVTNFLIICFLTFCFVKYLRWWRAKKAEVLKKNKRKKGRFSSP
jgi:hypothetical protein